MAKVVNMGYTDTAIAGNPTLNLARAPLNFAADYRVKTNQPQEVVLANITSPIDRPENVRIAFSNVANIYAGTSIEPSLAAPTKGGVSLLIQVTDVISVTDDTDPDYRIDLPVSYHLVIKVPKNENLTTTMIETGVKRVLSGLYDTGATTLTRLQALLRGSLVPTDI